jgi:hypothetical protein
MNKKLLKIDQSRSKFYIKDIWYFYVANLLESDSRYYVKQKRLNKVKNFYVLTKYYGPGSDPNGPGEEIEVMSYERFRKVVETFFKEVITEVIHGAHLRMGHYLGKIEPVRVERNQKKKVVDWEKTNANGKNPETGKYLKIAFFTDDDWCRIKWTRMAKIPNERSYVFDPAEGKVGFRTLFSEAQFSNPNLKLRYAFAAYIRGEE